MGLPYTFANVTTATGAQLDADFTAVGVLGTIPCIVSGTNTITLSPAANTPALGAYANYLRFSGIVAATNTGGVTVQVGSLGALPGYKDTSAGPIALVAGDLFAGNAAVFTYDSALNTGLGGFHISIPIGSGSGTVTSVATGTGLTGGTITSTGTVSLASVSNARILANVSGSSAAPTPNTLTNILDQIFGTTQGGIIYRNATNWVLLAPGTVGTKLTSGGAGANLSWT